MSDAAELQVRLAGDPPAIQLSRGEGVPDDFWFGLPLVLRVGQADGFDRRAAEVPIERFLLSRLALRDHCRHHGVGLDLDEGSRSLLRRAAQEGTAVRQRLEGQNGHATAPKLAATRFRRSLRDFQERDLAKLLDLPNGANFSVPGAGKTAVAYAAYEAERTAGRVDRLLVIAPLSAFEAWVTSHSVV